MPCASCCGLVPVGVCEPKISIMPIDGAEQARAAATAVAMVPSVVRKRSSSCADARARPLRSRPSSRSASCWWLRRPAASTCAERRVLGELVEHVLATRPGAGTRRPPARAAVGGMILRSRSVTKRSMIRASATTEASSRGQIGQPAAWMMANNAFCLGLSWGKSAGTLSQTPPRRQFPQMHQIAAAITRRPMTA